MRLAKITQAPAEQRDHGHKVHAFEHVEVFNALRFNDRQRIAQPTDRHDDDNRRQDQRKNHQAGLHGIGPAYREEAAKEGIGDSCQRTGPQRRFVAHAEGAFKQARAGNDAGSTIDSEEHQNHDGGDHAQDFAFVLKPAGEEVRQGQRIIVIFRLHAQATRHDFPVQPGTDGQTDGDPAFRNTGEKDGAG